MKGWIIMTKTLRNALAVLAGVTVMGGVSALAADTTLEEAFQTAIDNHETVVDITAFEMNSDEAMDAYLNYLETTPRNFFVEETVSCSYSTKTHNATTLTITYSEDAAAVEAELAEFDAAVEKAKAVVKSDMTDVDKAMAVHDYLIANVEYDTTYSNRNAYNALVEGTGVCEAYAKAYEYIMNELGIECAIVSSDAMNHAWNTIVIDGTVYHVDVTWDDPIVDGSNKNTTAYYDYFMLTDAEMEDAGHYAWN